MEHGVTAIHLESPSHSEKTRGILVSSLIFVVPFLLIFTFPKYEYEMKKEKKKSKNPEYLFHPSQHVHLSRQRNNEEV